MARYTYCGAMYSCNTAVMFLQTAQKRNRHMWKHHERHYTMGKSIFFEGCPDNQGLRGGPHCCRAHLDAVIRRLHAPASSPPRVDCMQEGTCRALEIPFTRSPGLCTGTSSSSSSGGSSACGVGASVVCVRPYSTGEAAAEPTDLCASIHGEAERIAG